MATNLIDNADSVRLLVETVEKASPKPFMFVDLEGVNLSRHGSISIMQILVPPSPEVHLVDVFILQTEAFDTPGAGEHTLRSILESPDFAKVFFDVRNDSDAMYSHFQVKLQGVLDLQLVEFASRPGRRRFLKGLAKCISEDARLDWTQSQTWQQTKAEGQRLFAPEKGGRYEVFLERPLSTAIVNYCAQDVLLMPKLLLVYGRRIDPFLATQVHAEGLRRVILSHGRDFNGKGRHMAVGPSFSWTRLSTQPTPDFPLDIVCSEEALIARCTINENLVSAKGDEELVVPTPSAAEEPTRDAVGELSHDLESLSVRDVTDSK